MVFRIPGCKTSLDNFNQWQLRGHIPDTKTVTAVDESLCKLAALAAQVHRIDMHQAELVPSYFVLLLQARSDC